ncbi:universal stress protein [Actinomycetospora sp. C-140]
MTTGIDPLALLAVGIWVAAGVLAALVLLGRQGYRDWRWYVAGAVLGPLFIPVAAERADRSTTVLATDGTVPHTGAPTVVVGVDGSPGADAAVRSTAALFDARTARVVLVAVVDPEAAHRSDDERRARARAMLLQRAGWFGPGGVADRVVLEVVGGQPARALRDVAAAQHAAVIVVGRRGTGLGPRLLGDVAGRLVRRAGVPVLLAEPARTPDPGAIGPNGPAGRRATGSASRA